MTNEKTEAAIKCEEVGLKATQYFEGLYKEIAFAKILADEFYKGEGGKLSYHLYRALIELKGLLPDDK